MATPTSSMSRIMQPMMRPFPKGQPGHCPAQKSPPKPCSSIAELAKTAAAKIHKEFDISEHEERRIADIVERVFTDAAKA